MFFSVVLALMAGFPVAFTLAGVSLWFALIGVVTGSFDLVLLASMPNRVFGIMTNETLVAVPLFVFMGVMLERARLAEDLLDSLGRVFTGMHGGLGIAVMVVGLLLAASTGIVGATVVTMGLLALPTMLRNGYRPGIAAGTICAAGTLGQIVPPSIILVLLGDVLSSAYQQAQLQQGIFSPKTVAVGDLFAGALIPGVLLVGLYIAYLSLRALIQPASMPQAPLPEGTRRVSWRLLGALVPPLALVLAVLGSIIGGLATPTEAAGVGALGALLLAAGRGQFTLGRLREVTGSTVRISAMVFLILIGASLFSLAFRGFGGDELVHRLLTGLPGGVAGAMLAVMLAMFLLGFVLDFIEITFVVVPIVGPILLMMGVDPVWLGIMIAINLQTSFLTPPFGFALFYLRGVAPPTLETKDIYRGAMPFVALQLLMLAILAAWPQLATWLPERLYG
ncbi:MAG: TRAP transporter large permease subunit [Gammaproteobacteria bacterium]|nr:TRAP transporter large permease subunit [Gammaproteobacteria bacterium]